MLDMCYVGCIESRWGDLKYHSWFACTLVYSCRRTDVKKPRTVNLHRRWEHMKKFHIDSFFVFDTRCENLMPFKNVDGNPTSRRNEVTAKNGMAVMSQLIWFPWLSVHSLLQKSYGNYLLLRVPFHFVEVGCISSNQRWLSNDTCSGSERSTAYTWGKFEVGSSHLIRNAEQ